MGLRLRFTMNGRRVAFRDKVEFWKFLLGLFWCGLGGASIILYYLLYGGVSWVGVGLVLLGFGVVLSCRLIYVGGVE